MLTYVAMILAGGVYFGASSLPYDGLVLLKPVKLFNAPELPPTFVGARIDKSNLQHLTGTYIVTLMSEKWGIPAAIGLSIGMEISDSTKSSEGADLADLGADALGIALAIATRNLINGGRFSLWPGRDGARIQYKF